MDVCAGYILKRYSYWPIEYTHWYRSGPLLNAPQYILCCLRTALVKLRTQLLHSRTLGLILHQGSYLDIRIAYSKKGCAHAHSPIGRSRREGSGRVSGGFVGGRTPMEGWCCGTGKGKWSKKRSKRSMLKVVRGIWETIHHLLVPSEHPCSSVSVVSGLSVRLKPSISSFLPGLHPDSTGVRWRSERERERELGRRYIINYNRSETCHCHDKFSAMDSPRSIPTTPPGGIILGCVLQTAVGCFSQ